MNNINIIIGSDHGGFEQKGILINYLRKIQAKAKTTLISSILDVGTNSRDSVDYPDYAKKVCDKVLSTNNSLGILICGTGYGMCIAANKIKGIRAVTITNVKMAPLAIEHNNINVVCLSGRFISPRKNIKIINKLLATNFSNDQRHINRLNKINNLK